MSESSVRIAADILIAAIAATDHRIIAIDEKLAKELEKPTRSFIRRSRTAGIRRENDSVGRFQFPSKGCGVLIRGHAWVQPFKRKPHITS